MQSDSDIAYSSHELGRYVDDEFFFSRFFWRTLLPKVFGLGQILFSCQISPDETLDFDDLRETILILCKQQSFLPDHLQTLSLRLGQLERLQPRFDFIFDDDGGDDVIDIRRWNLIAIEQHFDHMQRIMQKALWRIYHLHFRISYRLQNDEIYLEELFLITRLSDLFFDLHRVSIKCFF